MTDRNDIYDRLTVTEPPPTDIFRVYRANHPETLAFQPPVRVEKAQPDFKPETSITLRSGEVPEGQISILPLLTGAAAVSAATRDMNKVMDINDLLRDQKWEAAEDILGRKLTLEEKQQQLIGASVAEPEERAARELKMEALKGRLKTYYTKYKALLAKYKAAREKKARDEIKAELERVKKEAKAVSDEFLRMAGGWDDDDDDDAPGFLATHIPLPHDPDDLNTSFAGYFEDIDPTDWYPPGDDEESIAPTRIDPDSESIAETVVRARPRRPANVRDEEAKEHDTEPLYKTLWDRDTPWVDPHVKSRAPYVKRAEMLYDNFPSEAPELKGWNKLSVAQLSVEIPKVEDRLNELAAQERGKRAGKWDAKKPKTAAEVIAEADELLRRPEPLPQQGHGLFTGLRRPKNPQDFVEFGRMVIDAKKLKKSGQFSLIYPSSGQKNTVIRNAVLTPALKEVILSYLAKEPMDTMNLNEEESAWLKFVWKHAGLAKKQPVMRVLKKSKPDTMTRMKILIGHFQAGNDNPEVAAELDKLVRYAEGKRWLHAEDIIKIRQMMSD